MNTRLNVNEVSSFKASIAKAFAKLQREHKFIARRNWTCCQSCGFYEIEEKFPDSENIVFYHQQDNDSMDEGYVNLSWRGNGQAIVEALESKGLYVKWDGIQENRIRVLYRKPRQPKNQIERIRFTVNTNDFGSQMEYSLQITRKDGSNRFYQTSHVSSIAFDLLGWCVDDPEWLQMMRNSLSVYPIITYYFKDRTNDTQE